MKPAARSDRHFQHISITCARAKKRFFNGVRFCISSGVFKIREKKKKMQQQKEVETPTSPNERERERDALFADRDAPFGDRRSFFTPPARESAFGEKLGKLLTVFLSCISI